ncbi:MAG: IS3 family transposase, partial [Armatimonadota bacterium]
VTYIPTNEGWLYLAGVLDLCTRRIVGWSMSDSLDRTLVLRAILASCGRAAYQRRKPAAELIHHSDRGSQCASEDYRSQLKSYGMHQSMSRKGDCSVFFEHEDNAPMESFFGTLKMELVHLKKYTRRSEARRDIFEYLEVFYNKHRLHSSLGYVSPDQFEEQIAAEI